MSGGGGNYVINGTNPSPITIETPSFQVEASTGVINIDAAGYIDITDNSISLNANNHIELTSSGKIEIIGAETEIQSPGLISIDSTNNDINLEATIITLKSRTGELSLADDNTSGFTTTGSFYFDMIQTENDGWVYINGEKVATDGGDYVKNGNNTYPLNIISSDGAISIDSTNDNINITGNLISIESNDDSIQLISNTDAINLTADSGDINLQANNEINIISDSTVQVKGITGSLLLSDDNINELNSNGSWNINAQQQIIFNSPDIHYSNPGTVTTATSIYCKDSGGSFKEISISNLKILLGI